VNKERIPLLAVSFVVSMERVLSMSADFVGQVGKFL